MSPVGGMPASGRRAAPGPGVLRLIAVCAVLFGLFDVAWHHPVAVPAAVRLAVASEVAQREPGFRVMSTRGVWRPAGGLAEVVLERGSQVRVDRFRWDSGGVAFVSRTVGRAEGLLPFLGMVALVTGGAWLFIHALLYAFSPKCRRHRWLALRTERVRAYSGGVNDQGLSLPAIDILVQRCPRGDYVRRRVIEGPHNPNPEAVVADGFVTLPGNPWVAGLGYWRNLFRGRVSDAEWQEMFRSLKARCEGEGPLV